MKTSRAVTFISVAAVVTGLAVLAILSAGYLHGTEVCTVCGAESETRWLFSFRMSSRVTPTRLSTMLATNGLPGPHEHRWMFAQAGGIPPLGPMCALGRGHWLFRTIGTPQCVAFLDNLIRFDSTAAADPYIRQALDPDAATTFDRTLIAEDFPDSGFPDAPTFQSWWLAHKTRFDAALAAR